MALSELQIGLAVLGAAGVAGVLAYNKWQERKYRRQAEQAFRSDHADVLLEPGTAAPGETAQERAEPTLAAAPRAAALEAEPAAPAAAPAHDELDCVAGLEAGEPIAAGSLWLAQHQSLAALERRLRWFGWDEGAGQWRALDARSALACRRVAAALQLVDRNGPVSDAELDAFGAGMQQLADRFMAVAEVPDLMEARLRAGALDSFCAAVDVQIGINIVSGGAEGFAGTRLRGVAEAAGMRLAADGLFHGCDDDGATLFTLGNLESAMFSADAMKALSTNGLTLSLDVPRVSAGVQAFDRMLATARELAERLDGALVDDNRAPLTEKSLEFIRGKIAEFQQQMAEHGLPAGSPAALRLFS